MSYILKSIYEETYIKTSTKDTNIKSEAKRFKTLSSANNFRKNNTPGYMYDVIRVKN